MKDRSNSREQLVREADEARAKLLHTVEELDRRRHDALNWPLRLKQDRGQVALAGAVLLILIASTLALFAHRIASGAQRRRRNRWRLARDVWIHPERVIRAERPPFFVELARSLLRTILSTAVMVPARRVVTLVLSPSEEHRSNGSAPTAPTA